jgi:thiol:disulfide interchange protein
MAAYPGRVKWVVFCLLSCSCAPRRLEQPWLAYAVEEATATNKPLVIEFYATWCGPCRVFAESVLPDLHVKAALSDVLFLRYDVDRPTGADAARRCGIKGVPSVVGIDHDGLVRLRKTGTEPTADEFLVFLRQAHEVLGPGPARAARPPAP